MDILQEQHLCSDRNIQVDSQYIDSHQSNCMYHCCKDTAQQQLYKDNSFQQHMDGKLHHPKESNSQTGMTLKFLKLCNFFQLDKPYN